MSRRRVADLSAILLAATSLAVYVVSIFLTPAAPVHEDEIPIPAIARDGFGRPVRLGSIDASGDAQVALASGAGAHYAIWEEPGGMRSELLVGSQRNAALPIIETTAIRGLWGGSAGGDPVVAWIERSFDDGSYTLQWNWRGELRTAARAASEPLVRFVQGASEPHVVLARPGREGWSLAIVGWSGNERNAPPRAPQWSLRGLDAIEVDGLVQLAWLEGTNDVLLGRLQSTWTAWRATWPADAAAPTATFPVGAARWSGVGDVVRLANRVDGVHLAWPRSDGRLVVTDAQGTDRDLGHGYLLGATARGWLWFAEDVVWERTMVDPARAVLRLPAVPEQVAFAADGAQVALAWSSGRYLGGLEVWGVGNAEPYTPTPLDRAALAMGWDPWQPWSSILGHLLTSILVGLLFATAMLPLWWIGAAVLGRGGLGPRPSALLDGVVLGSSTLLVLVALLRLGSVAGLGTNAATSGGTLLHALALALGCGVAFLVLRGRDVEATSGRLLAATLAGTIALAVWAFGTLTAWQALLGAPT